MIGLLIRGAVYLARTVEYVVQAGRSFIVSFVGLLPLAGLGASESGVDCGVIGVVAIASAFVSIAPELAGAVLGLNGVCLVGCVFTMSQPAVLTRNKAGLECCEGGHGLQIFLAEVPGEPLVADIMLKGCQGFGIRKINNLVLFS